MLMWEEIVPPKKQEEGNIKWSWKLNYEETVSDWNKLKSLIEKVVMRNTNIITQNKYDSVMM